MTNAKTLESLIERAAALPEDAQAEFVDAVADAMEQIEAKHGALYRLSIEERAGIERGLRELRERRFASEEAVAAVFRRARNAGA
jgi:transcription elongation GreA/GreB family factor